MDRAHLDRQEAYATFNMGVGFAVYVDAVDAERCVRLAETDRFTAWIGGSVLEVGSKKAVEIVEEGIVFQEDSLRVRD
jgi:phosphoribosylformylglycinamidine cyclo-ligase